MWEDLILNLKLLSVCKLIIGKLLSIKKNKLIFTILSYYLSSGRYHSPSGTDLVPKFRFNKGKYTLVSPFYSLYFRFLFDSTSSNVFYSTVNSYLAISRSSSYYLRAEYIFLLILSYVKSLGILPLFNFWLVYLILSTILLYFSLPD